MKKMILPLIAFVLIESCGNKDLHPVQNQAGDTIAVKVTPIVSGNTVEEIHTSGLLTTQNEARLSFKTGGIIDHINVEEGQRVSKGELLASLNATEIGAQVAQSLLAVEKARRDYQRAQNLFRDSVVTLEQLQNAKTGLDMANEVYQQAIFNQQYSKIVAPAGGFIVKKIANQGELAAPGVPVVVMNIVSNESPWILKAGVSDKEWAAISLGDKATVQLDGFAGKTFPAWVINRALASDPMTGSFEIELQIDFHNEHPGAGMFGKAIIYPSGSVHAFTIPYEALLEANGKMGFVFVTDDKRTARKVPVIISQINENTVTLSSGLEGHSYLIVSGSPFLQDHSPISIKP